MRAEPDIVRNIHFIAVDQRVQSIGKAVKELLQTLWTKAELRVQFPKNDGIQLQLIFSIILDKLPLDFHIHRFLLGGGQGRAKYLSAGFLNLHHLPPHRKSFVQRSPAHAERRQFPAQS